MSPPEAQTQRNTSKKRKRPPSFHHLPTFRAKKLKKEWVEGVKIKRAYRAEKKKMTAGTGSNAGVTDGGWGQRRKSPVLEGGEDGTKEGENTGNIQEADDNREVDPHKAINSQLSTTSEPSASKQPEKANKGLSQQRRADGKHKRASADTSDPKPSPRDLKREAYSRASLHAGKSNPLQRRRDDRKTRTVDPKTATELKTPGRYGERRRGQPNMALRMASMLEEIKRKI